jgi:two-component system phosphate regulon sensor histidine kinase PhoR
VYVRDTGVGIPAEDLPRLFERFYRVDKARSRQLGGTGLGLSIVKHMIASHNGVVRVESVVNSGSTFFFTLPADEAALENRQLNPEFTTS